MSNFYLTLMHREALRRLEDAQLLAGRGDSAHLLSLLGMELLLKLVHEVAVGRKTSHGHKYELIFRDLPDETKNEIIQRAGNRIGPSELNTAAPDILKKWGENFITLRYPYEKYEGLTEEEYHRLGAEWIEAGAPVEKALFRYFPKELFGMVDALKQMADEMASNSFQPTRSR
jgi:HEPN domain-containing protein